MVEHTPHPDPIAPYEAYRLDWMARHGHSLPQLMRQLARLQEECDEQTTVEELFDLWEQEYGFDGSLWVCYDEWKGAEGQPNTVSKGWMEFCPCCHYCVYPNWKFCPICGQTLIHRKEM